MLEKKGGVIAEMLKEMEAGGMLDELDNGTALTLLKSPAFRNIAKLIRKHKDDVGTTICPECGKETHYKGLISRCEECGKYIVGEDLGGENQELKQVLDVMNGVQ